VKISLTAPEVKFINNCTACLFEIFGGQHFPPQKQNVMLSELVYMSPRQRRFKNANWSTFVRKELASKLPNLRIILLLIV
jgi:hypothetical protein